MTTTALPLDPEISHPKHGSPPGRRLDGDLTSLTACPPLKTPVWIVYGGRWRQGYTTDVGEQTWRNQGRTRQATVRVLYSANRAGRELAHRFNLVDIRIRDLT